MPVQTFNFFSSGLVSKAILITHPFGGIMETEAIVAITKKHSLIIFEDCAQAYAGNYMGGNSESDVIMLASDLLKPIRLLAGRWSK